MLFDVTRVMVQILWPTPPPQSTALDGLHHPFQVCLQDPLPVVVAAAAPSTLVLLWSLQ